MGDHRRATAELDQAVAQAGGDHFHLLPAARVEPRIVRGDGPAVGADAEHAGHLAGHGHAGHVAGPATTGGAGGDGGRRRLVEVLGLLFDLVGAPPVQAQGHGRLGQAHAAELEDRRLGALGAHVHPDEQGAAHGTELSGARGTRSKREALTPELDSSTSKALRSPRWKAVKYSSARRSVV